jgi:hypothetical protein
MPELQDINRLSGNHDGKLQKACVVCVAEVKMWQSININLKNMPVYGQALPSCWRIHYYWKIIL